MKLQIQGQNLRFRVDETELERLLSGESLDNRTDLGEQGAFAQTITLHAQADAELQSSTSGWRVLLPVLTVRDYVTRLPCRDALTFQIRADPAPGLQLKFEVDVRDSVRRRGVPGTRPEK
ncbi:MAG TPA: hypothetical protein PK159_02140 [Steroidobacteraceae bacterium]|nr:hypothetical protein [Steroidobacteraceae bacterium]